MVWGSATPATPGPRTLQVGIVSRPTVQRPERDLWVGAAAPEARARKASRVLPHFTAEQSIAPPPVPALEHVASPDGAAVVVTGPELARFTKEDWAWLLRHGEIVLARTTPEQKLAFVQVGQGWRGGGPPGWRSGLHVPPPPPRRRRRRRATASA